MTQDTRGDVMRWWYGNGGKAGTDTSFDDIYNQYTNRNPNSGASQQAIAAGNGTYTPVTMNIGGQSVQAKDNEYWVPQNSSSTQQQQSPFDMNAFFGQFNNMFSQYNAQNDARMQALEKMLTDMQNKNAYNASQSQNQNITQNPSNGQHTFVPQEQGNDVNSPGYTQSNNSMNDTLYKYLSGIWQGGF